MSSTDDRRLVPVVVQGDRFVIDAAQIIGVEQGDRVQRNPGSGPPYGWLLGSSDGMAVFGLATILGKVSGDDSRTGPGSVLVLSRSNGELWGLLVDHADGSVQVPADDVLDLSGVVGSILYSAVVQLKDDPMVLLATENLHPEDAERAVNRQVRERRAHRESLGTAAREAAPPARKMLWISIDSEQLFVGLSAKQVVEIRDPLPIAPVPGTKRDIAGLVLRDRQALPVVDLNHLLDVSIPRSPQARLLIARCTRSGRQVGLPIFGEVRLVDLPIAHQATRLDSDHSSWVRGSFLVEAATLLIPDLDAILD